MSDAREKEPEDLPQDGPEPEAGRTTEDDGVVRQDAVEDKMSDDDAGPPATETAPAPEPEAPGGGTDAAAAAQPSKADQDDDDAGTARPGVSGAGATGEAARAAEAAETSSARESDDVVVVENEAVAAGAADGIDGDGAADGVDDGGAPERPEIGGRSRIWEVLRPAGRRAEYITAALCVAFGFALAVQVAQSTGDQLASLRQDELVRLLDEVTQRGDQLEAEVTNLTQARDDLRSADGRDRAARELAEQRAEYEGILSGRLPAEGPGVVIEIASEPGTISAADMFNALEELRNAGVEAQEINNVRIVTSSHFTETVDGHIMLDGNLLNVPYVWTAIGDPDTVGPALEIPGGALPTLRDHGATATVVRQDNVAVDATRAPEDPEHATTGSG